MSWSKPYTIDFGPTGDNIKQGVDKSEDDIDDIYANLNKLKNSFIGTSAPASPDTGQIWGDSNHTPTLYKYYNGSIWISLTKPSYRGQMINGKISVTVGSNNLTLALKTSLGNDPSVSDPVSIRIGDTVRTISAALSVTANAATNWGNAGGSELATKEIDWFVYLGYNATDGVVIGFSRIPFACQYSDFSVTSTDEKFCKISTITTAAATDYYEVIGRFAATLSAGAGYTWTVPTFTAINLIQRPIYETRRLDFVSQIGGFTTSTQAAKYQLVSNNLYSELNIYLTSNGATLTATIPFKALISVTLAASITDSGTNGGGMSQIVSGNNYWQAYKDWASTSFTASGTKGLNNFRSCISI
jgi:hypothetical protein